jgi:hypothetical protein
MSAPNRMNKKVPAVAVSERGITKIEQLPDHLRRLATTLPPYQITKDACKLRGVGRSKLHELKNQGRVRAVKSDASVLWETLSILLDLANLPLAPTATATATEKKKPIASAPTSISTAPPITPAPAPPRDRMSEQPTIARINP